jgi:hypothetical protein
MEDELVGKLADKSITTGELFHCVEENWGLVPRLIEGISSSNASTRYGCSKVLVELSEAYPSKLYPYMDFFVELLDNKRRILVWNALATISNLTRADENNKFDAIFDKYLGFLNDEYMVTVGNVVSYSGKIAMAKPYLVDKIADALLKLDRISLTPHLTEECRRVIVEKAIRVLDGFFPKIEDKNRVISFVEKQASSPRKTLRATAKDFLRKWKS